MPSLTPSLLLKGLILLTTLAGFLGILLRRHLFLKVMALDVMSTGVIGFFVLLAARGGVRTPILAGLSLTGLRPPAGTFATLASGGWIPFLDVLVAIKVTLGSWAMLQLFVRYRGLL